MCKAIASWHVSDASLVLCVVYATSPFSYFMLCSQEIRSEDLHNEVCQVLHGYKQVSGVVLFMDTFNSYARLFLFV